MGKVHRYFLNLNDPYIIFSLYSHCSQSLAASALSLAAREGLVCRLV